MKPLRKSSLVQVLERVAPPRALKDEDPVSFMAQVIVACSGTHQLLQSQLHEFKAALTDWRAGNGTFEECMGWAPGQGGRRSTVRARQIRAAQKRAVEVLVASVGGQNAHQQAEAILPIARGLAPAPNEAAQRSLAELDVSGGKLPSSKSAIYVLVTEAISAK